MEKGIIHVACNIDASYVKYCVVMLTSLFENNADSSFHVHVIASELPDDSKKILHDWIEAGITRPCLFMKQEMPCWKDVPFMERATSRWLHIIVFSWRAFCPVL